MAEFPTPEDARKFDAHFYPTGDKKMKGITHVPKNKNHPWRVFYPGMEARGFFVCLKGKVSCGKVQYTWYKYLVARAGEDAGRNLWGGRGNGGGTFVVVNLPNFITSGKKILCNFVCGQEQKHRNETVLSIIVSLFYSYVFLSLLCLVREVRPWFYARMSAAWRWSRACSTVRALLFFWVEKLVLCVFFYVQVVKSASRSSWWNPFPPGQWIPDLWRWAKKSWKKLVCVVTGFARPVPGDWYEGGGLTEAAYRERPKRGFGRQWCESKSKKTKI